MKLTRDEIDTLGIVLDKLFELKTDMGVQINETCVHFGARKAAWVSFNARTGHYDAEICK